MLVLGLLGASCTSCNVGYCHTLEGMRFTGAVDGSMPNPISWCEENQHIENYMVSYMGHGENLKRYNIFYHSVGSWKDPWGRAVGGYTICVTGEMHVGTGKEVYAHEMAHALQSCQSPLPIDESTDIDHSNWYRDGIFEAIGEASK